MRDRRERGSGEVADPHPNDSRQGKERTEHDELQRLEPIRLRFFDAGLFPVVLDFGTK
jgi:hypothetical protein